METDGKNYYVSVAGIIGSGKTTAVELLSQNLGFHKFEENVKENIFIPLFYKDPKRWAFPAQIFYLQDRIGQLKKIKELLHETNVIQDSSLYQDSFTYAKAQVALGYMTNGEYALYQKLFDEFKLNLPEPRLIINLEASLRVIKKRIQKRAREFEKEVDMSYIKTLADMQKEWTSGRTHLPIFTINTDHLNIAENKNHQKEFVQLVKDSINRL